MKSFACPKVQNFKRLFNKSTSTKRQHTFHTFIHWHLFVLHNHPFKCLSWHLPWQLSWQLLQRKIFFWLDASVYRAVHVSPFNVHCNPKGFSHSSVCKGIFPKISVSLYIQQRTVIALWTFMIWFMCTETRREKLLNCNNEHDCNWGTSHLVWYHMSSSLRGPLSYLGICACV